MRVQHVIALLISIIVASELLAQQKNSVSFFVSGIQREHAYEYDTSFDVTEAEWWKGGVGFGVEHQFTKALAIEASFEYRHDVTSKWYAASCNDAYHGTCFIERHVQLTSTPIVVRGVISHAVSDRWSVFGTAGLRYVPEPSASDLTTFGTGHGGYPVETSSASDGEIGGGASWRATERLDLYAEGRFLLGHATDWNPSRRLAGGIRFRF